MDEREHSGLLFGMMVLIHFLSETAFSSGLPSVRDVRRKQHEAPYFAYTGRQFSLPFSTTQQRPFLLAPSLFSCVS